MAFDGIVTKAISTELQDLTSARVDKVFQPNKNTVLLGLYLNGCNYLLNICIDSQNYRINLTTHQKANPKVAPNFCMLLRKHLIGMHIKSFTTNNLERLVIIDFEGFDELDDVVTKRLIVELMGKHCNIILLDEQNVIIDSLRHINNEDSNRSIVPRSKYIYPSTNKHNFLDCLDFENFYNLVSSNDIYNVFNGLSKSFIDFCISYLNIDNFDKDSLKKLYEHICNIIYKIDSNSLDFKVIDSKKKDFVLIEADNTNCSPFHLNFFIDDFYYAKETSEAFKSYRDSVLRMILDVLKKLQKRLVNIDAKLNDCKDMDKYKLYGELITANLYKIKSENVNEIEVDNYYTNEKIKISLDNRYTPAINAKLFFKKYHKLKNALEIVSVQKQETLKDLDYIESIVYELESSSSLEDVAEIFDEISENVIFKEKVDNFKNKSKKEKIKKSSLTQNKTVSFNPLKYKIGNYVLLVGRNNKENDFLTLKYAKKSDFWFHTKDIHSSHCILQINNGVIPDESVLLRCAEITAYHSKARLSSNVPVDFCEVRFVRKPSRF